MTGYRWQGPYGARVVQYVRVNPGSTSRDLYRGPLRGLDAVDVGAIVGSLVGRGVLDARREGQRVRLYLGYVASL